MEKVPSWIERMLLPKLSEISGEIKALNSRIDGVENKIDGVEKSLNYRIDGIEKSLNARIDSLQNALESFRNETLVRFEAVHTRLDAIEKRFRS